MLMFDRQSLTEDRAVVVLAYATHLGLALNSSSVLNSFNPILVVFVISFIKKIGLLHLMFVFVCI